MVRDSFLTPAEGKKKNETLRDEFTVFIYRDREGLVPGSIPWKLEVDMQSDAGVQKELAVTPGKTTQWAA